MDDVELQFNLCNSDSVERIERAKSIDLGSHAEEKFGDIVCGGYVGRVSSQSVALSAETPSDKLTATYLIPHHFSLRSRVNSYGRELISAGCIIDFSPGHQNFALVDLLPNSSFRKLFESKAKASIELSFDKVAKLIGLPVPLDFSERGGISTSLDFGFAFHASEIAAVGRGTQTAIFEFSGGAGPLVDRDVTVWTVIMFNRFSSSLSCRVKLFYTSRLAFVPSRCESDWTNIHIVLSEPLSKAQ